MYHIRLSKIWFGITLFSIAMGFMESAVVVYLRGISYPNGFDFPLAYMEKALVNTEIMREIATLIMLMTIGYVGGRNRWEKFAWFIYCFAIWDIFYYLFLKLLLNWPDSILTWDVLFLIPVVWVGPVLAPVILSLTMILMAWIIIYFGNSISRFNIKWYEWIIIGCGSITVFLAFVLDYTSFILKHHSLAELLKAENFYLIQNTSQQYIPLSFNWLLFLTGEFFIITGLFAVLFRSYKIMKQNI